MTRCLWIICLLVTFGSAHAAGQARDSSRFYLEFYGDSIRVVDSDWRFVDWSGSLSDGAIGDFYDHMKDSGFEPYIQALLHFKEKHQLSDWLYYQLLRKVAEQISPKAADYNRYTLYKWYLLSQSGYDATLAIRDGRQLLFYVYSLENIYDIPCFFKGDRQYVCLNYHDFGRIDFTQLEPVAISIHPVEALNPFSYKVAQMPDFPIVSYTKKELSFQYHNRSYQFNVLINEELSKIFKNYPVVDYESYLNIPMTNTTYQSLIPDLRAAVKGMKQKQGIDYLMQFTRSAFAFETDQNNFGKEKRMSPELTLLYEQSDCDDRVALFFYLIKELYNLPMIVLLYPEHVTIAVKMDKPIGRPVRYNNEWYSVCEPTPQPEDLKVGQLSPDLNGQAFQIAYAYVPEAK